MMTTARGSFDRLGNTSWSFRNSPGRPRQQKSSTTKCWLDILNGSIEAHSGASHSGFANRRRDHFHVRTEPPNPGSVSGIGFLEVLDLQFLNVPRNALHADHNVTHQTFSV